MEAHQESPDLEYQKLSRHTSHDSGFGSVDKNDSFDFHKGDFPLDNFQSKVAQNSDDSDTTFTVSTNSSLLQGVDREEGREPKAVLTTHPDNMLKNDALEEVDWCETRETGALRQFYPKLLEQMKQQLDQVSPELYSEGLIEYPTLCQVSEVSGQSFQAKAEKVLDAVRAKVISGPENFTIFIQILEKCGFKEISEKILERYSEKQVKVSVRRLSPMGHSDSEMVKNMERPSVAQAGVQLTKNIYRCTESHSASDNESAHYCRWSTSPPGWSSDESDQEMQGQESCQNIEVLRVKEMNRKLRKEVQELHSTNKGDIKVKPMAEVKSLEIQNLILLCKYCVYLTLLLLLIVLSNCYVILVIFKS